MIDPTVAAGGVACTGVPCCCMKSGRRSRNTIVTIVAAVLTGALVLAVWIVVMNTRPDTPDHSRRREGRGHGRGR